jgi:hypothetical protein
VLAFDTGGAILDWHGGLTAALASLSPRRPLNNTIAITQRLTAGTDKLITPTKIHRLGAKLPGPLDRIGLGLVPQLGQCRLDTFSYPFADWRGPTGDNPQPRGRLASEQDCTWRVELAAARGWHSARRRDEPALRY